MSQDEAQQKSKTAKKTKEEVTPHFSGTQLAEIKDWVDDQYTLPESKRAPTVILVFVQAALIFFLEFQRQKATIAQMRDLVAKAFGLVPSTERRKRTGTNTPKRTLLEMTVEELEAIVKRLRQKIGSSYSEAKEVAALRDEKLAANKTEGCRDVERAKSSDKEAWSQAPNPTATDEELEQLRDKAYETLDTILEKLDSDSGLRSPSEAIFRGEGPAKGSLTVQCKAPSAGLFDFTRSAWEKSSRIHIALERTDIEVWTEVKTSNQDERSRGSTRILGQPNLGITDGTLAQITQLATNFGLPENRLAILLGGGEAPFTRDNISRWLGIVAEKAKPIYERLFLDVMLSRHINMDDTGVDCQEIKRWLAAEEELEQGANKAAELAAHRAGAPWMAPKPPSDGKPAEWSLVQSLSRDIAPFRSQQRRSEGGKVKLNLTVLIGSGVPDVPESSVTFYRTHLGTAGDLLAAGLIKISASEQDDEEEANGPGAETKSETIRDVFVQSDLMSANFLPKNFSVKGIRVTRTGCLAHARRLFLKAKDQIPDTKLQQSIEESFSDIYAFEGLLDQSGRTRGRVLEVRNSAVLLSLVGLYIKCEVLAIDYSSKTAVGEFARYIIRNWPYLTVYLREPYLSPDNNISERALRYEKILAKASGAKKSLHGRACHDILRTLSATCSNATVNFDEYILWILQQNPAELEAQPESFTPYAFSLCLEENKELKEKLRDHITGKIFHTIAVSRPPAH